MRKFAALPFVLLGMIFLAGCAAKEVVLVRDAAAVKTDAVEPVIFRSDRLFSSLNSSLKKFRPILAMEDERDEIMAEIKEQIEKTKRFKHAVFLSGKDVTTAKEGFLIYPEVLSVKMETRGTYDPKRKRFIATAKGCLIVYDAEDKTKEIEIFTSEKRFEKMGKSGITTLNADEQNEQIKTVLKYVFVDLAIKLGDEFNPSYVMGTIQKLSGKTVYVHIKTDELRGQKAKDQSIAVIDEDNKPLASIELINIDDGGISGTLYSKANTSIREGMKVRARIYRANE